MTVQATIEGKLQHAFSPSFMELLNESHLHKGPPGRESHFKLVLVSSDFVGKRLLQRHRLVNQLLTDELAGEVHALALHTYTPDEWQSRQQQSPLTPNCRGS